MKYMFSGLILSLSISVFAHTPEEKKALLESQETCGNFVHFDENNMFTGFGNYKELFEEPRNPMPGQMNITSFETKMTSTIDTDDSVIDVATDGNTAFVLTYSGIEEWNLETKTRVAIHPTHTQTAVVYKEHAEQWARYNDELIIAHGIKGVSFFDMKTRKITSTLELATSQYPLQSQTTGIAISGKFAYAVLDSYSIVDEAPFPFKGIVKIDLETKKVVQELGGMDPGVDSIAAMGNKLIVSFYGFPVWKYDLTDFKPNAKKLPNPEIRVFRFPIAGHPWGHASLDDKNYYTCYWKRADETNPRVKIPAVLDRSTLLLD